MATITYTAFDAALAQAKLATTPSELHGSLTGYLCASRGGRSHQLLDALALDGDAAGDDLLAQMDMLATDIEHGLRAGDPMAPLLPPGPLPARADAMVDWCRGFLGGIGLAGVAPASGHASEVNALLADFGQIAAMHLECADDDDAAFDDVLDFIRTGVARLHSLFMPAGRQ